MMPAVQDFEQRLGILHQVEPILENAINTLSKVVDMRSSLPAALLAPPAEAAPAPAPRAAAPDLNSLKALLAQAQAKQAPPEPEPEAEDPLAALLGGGGGGGGGLGGLAGLLGSLGGGGEEDSSAYQTPSFLSAPAAPAPEPVEEAPSGLPAGLDEALLAKLLGGAL